MAKSTFDLPDNYREIYALDLQKDKKTAVLVNSIAIALMVTLIIAGTVAKPGAFSAMVSTFIQSIQSGNFYTAPFMLLALGAGQLAYIILHELTHGVFIKIFSRKKAKYGFTGLYAFASSEAYFNKRDYIIIALAPVVLWGIVLFMLCSTVPPHWFWIVYLIQITNLSGAAGDFYVTWKFSKLPSDILVKDAGTSMKVYSAN